MILYDITDPIKAKKSKWAAGQSDSILEDIDFKNLRLPLLLLVFAITAYYQLVWKKKPEKNFGDDIVEKIEASVGRRLDDKISSQMRKAGLTNK